MAIKNIILKGISRVPDDSTASVTTRSGAMVSEMQMAVNMANDGAGLTLIEKPDTIFQLGVGEDCVFIHQNTSYKNYIIKKDNQLLWVDKNSYSVRDQVVCSLNGELNAISAIGNTLIIDDGEVKYVLLKVEGDSTKTYKDLGSKPPFVEIQFGLQSEFVAYPGKTSDNVMSDPISITGSGSLDDMPWPYYATTDSWVPPKAIVQTDNPEWVQYCTYSIKDKVSRNGVDSVDREAERLTQGVMARINKFVADEVVSKNKFVFPFFVRYAYEMYDGSLMMHSYPVLMIPNSRGPVFGLNSATSGHEYPDDSYSDSTGFELDYQSGGNWRYTFRGRIYGFISKLLHTISVQPTGIEDWKDLIKGVNIYVSAPVYTYDQSGHCYGWENMDDSGSWDSYYSVAQTTNCVTTAQKNLQTYYYKRKFEDLFKDRNQERVNSKSYFYSYSSDYRLPSYILSTPEKSIDDIRDGLIGAAQFYKISTIEIDDLISNWNRQDQEVKIKDNVLKTLVNRQQMDDDYHSHDSLHTSIEYVYNKRLNLGGASRTLHNPISPIVQWCRSDDSTLGECCISVFIKTGSGDAVVKSESTYSGRFPMYVFYPNSKAYKAVIETDAGTMFEIELTEHPNLEGAYWLFSLWSEDTATIYSGDSPAISNNVVNEPGKVFTSNTENPFIFQSTNINQVGDGTIRALCANTQAVNAYNFGYATMYAFTSEGVWGLNVNDTGGFQAIQPITRDVITAGTKPVALGQHIIFLANKGVMRIDINSSLTKCISNGLHGYVGGNYPSVSAILDAVLTSEVADNLKFALNLDDSSEFFWLNGETKMVYDYRNNRVLFSDGNGAWVYNMKSETWTQTQTSVNTALNAWPECEFVEGGNVVTMDGEQSKYSYGALLTRPIATGSEWYSRLKQVFAKGNFPVHSNDVELALYGCRNYSDYSLVASSTCGRITRHFGSGFKEHAILAVVDILHGKSSDDEEMKKQSNIFSLDRFDVDIEGDEQDKLR